MSHIESGDFCVTDIEVLASVIATKCPTLELVKTNEYRNWVTDHGRLAGDYPLPGVYQIRLIQRWADKTSGGLRQVRNICSEKGVQLPANIAELESSPLTLDELSKLGREAGFKTAYNEVVKQIGQDAEYVIRVKDSNKQQRYYGIGLVPNPVRDGEWDFIVDFWQQGQGLLNEPGVGKHCQIGGETAWAAEIKTAYNVALIEKAIQHQQMLGNTAYASVSREVLADGTIKIVTSGY
jgi:hypothetical protein